MFLWDDKASPNLVKHRVSRGYLLTRGSPEVRLRDEVIK
jgi:hypothetical protein